MGYIAGGSFVDAPRFVMFFKGGSFHPASTNPTPITDLAGTPIAPLAPHAQDIILFKGMSIHGGSPKTDGYQEEHGAGLIGCVTGNSYHYSKNDSYYAYTDHESIDITIANHYKTVPRWRRCRSRACTSAPARTPTPTTSVSASATSRTANARPATRSTATRSSRSRTPARSTTADAAGERASARACRTSPPATTAKLKAALERKKSLIDFRLADIADAKRVLGMDSEHARKLDGLVDGWREVESATNAQLAALQAGARRRRVDLTCPTLTRPTGNGTKKLNCDQLSPVHDQMIALIKLAFEWDLTRVVAYTLSGASSGQSLPSQGVTQAHHTLEHSNNVAGLNIMGTYYAEKFAGLLAALKSIDDGDGQDRALQQLGRARHGVLERQLERPLPDQHSVHPRGAGRRQVPDRPHRRRGQAQQQRPADLGPERVGHRLERLRPGEPVQGPDRLTAVRGRSGCWRPRLHPRSRSGPAGL